MRRLPWMVALVLGVSLLGACGNSGSLGAASSSSVATSAAVSSRTTAGQPANDCAVGPGTSGNGAAVSIGSKAFAEEELLATITQLVLEKGGFKVTYTTKAADPVIDQALRSGSIDMLWQYRY